MSERKAVDAKSGLLVFTPAVDFFFGGISCKSRTPMSSLSLLNRDCIQRGDMETETAFTFHHVLRYIARRRPRWFILENVGQLLEVTVLSDSQISDAEFIVQSSAEIGYFVMYHVFNAHDFGSPANRLRVYFTGWELACQGPCPSIDTGAFGFCTRLHNAMTIPPLPLEEFLLTDEELSPTAVRHTDIHVRHIADTDQKWKR